MLNIVVPPHTPSIELLCSGSYAAPVMWDEAEWASPTPCCLGWVLHKIADFEVEGRLCVRCPVCDKSWEVIWDPWRHGRGHAIWVD